MYPGTMAIMAAETRPAPVEYSSLVSLYVTMLVREEKSGARNTHTSRTLMVTLTVVGKHIYMTSEIDCKGRGSEVESLWI